MKFNREGLFSDPVYSKSVQMLLPSGGELYKNTTVWPQSDKVSLQSPTEASDNIPEPINSVGKSIDSVGKPIYSIGKPIYSVGKPIDSVGKPIDSVRKPIDCIGKSTDHDQMSGYIVLK